MKPSREELYNASQMKKDGMRIPKIMEYMGISNKYTYSSFRWFLYKFEIEENKGIVFEDSKVQEQDFDSIEDYYDKLKSLEESMKEIDTKQTEATITLKDNKPICLAFWGDWHLGSRGVNYNQFDKDRELIKNTEGLYFIGMGDYIDNNSAYVTKSTNENMIPQEMQRNLAMSMMKQVGDKAIALIEGCHENFSYKVDGHNFVTDLCLAVKCVNLWHGGIININLGNESYKVVARHRYKNESGLNTTNAHRNLLNSIGPCDILALAHLHFPDMQMLDRMGKKVVYFRSGSYKEYDDYGQRLGGYKAKPGIPCAILFPKYHKIVPFQDLEDAIIFLKSVR